MSLFQKSVEKKYLNELDTVLVDRKYKDFQNYFGNPAIQENIRNSKEEQFQEGFLRELFVSILGYTLNPHPDFNLTTELKNIANSKKADGAILKGEDAVAVIELKGTDTTDLDKIETQAFGYKNHHPNCVYVITSNFEKLRFYIQNAVDHLDFDLFNLTREQFSLLWLCLAKDNLLNGLPQKIKESSVLQEENITKKLYADYSKFREAIFNNLVTNNPETDKLLLFRKTQKLIDRFLFIFFAEDRLLVPPNSISQIIEKWKDDVDFGDAKPLYHTFKKYFHVLNVGRPKSGNRQEIFAYNGGLFSEDEILDNINIDDTVLYEHTLKLSQYNYETDVDVNILGHIFEHSLGEIENVQAEIKGEKVDSQKTKRKKDGIFYTPKYITKYIVENTVGKLCEEKRAALEIIDEEYAKGRKNRKKDTIASLDKKLTEYRNWLLSLTILDPACGSGAFLNQALDFLITEHRKIDDLRAQLFGSGLVFSDITTDILEKNIYGVDINEESVEIAKLSLWLRTAQNGRKLNKLNNNIKCGNSLIDDPQVAGEKAFKWQNEFPEIFAKGGFDVVIGNPPYVRVQNLNYEIIDWLKNNKQTAHKRIDISTLFVEEALKLINENGLVSFITSNQFFKAEYGRKLREKLKGKLYCNLDFSNVSVFEGLATYVSILSFSLQSVETLYYSQIVDTNINLDNIIWHKFNFDNFSDDAWDFNLNQSLKYKIYFNSILLGDCADFIYGIITGHDAAFIVSHEVAKDLNLEKEILFEFVKPENYSRYGIEKLDKYIIYPYDSDNNIFSEDSLKNNFRNTYDYLFQHKDTLENRMDSRYSIIEKGLNWYVIMRRVNTKEITKSKIIFYDVGMYPNFCLDKSGYAFGGGTSHSLSVKNKFDFQIEYLLAILNSKLIGWIIQDICPIKMGGARKYGLDYIRKLPIKKIALDQQEQYVILSQSITESTAKLHFIKTQFTTLLISKFEIEKLSQKLQNWHELDFKDFLKELQKAKIKLTLSEEADWMNYFNEQKQKAQILKAEIEKTDKEIDRMVYELYGLTEEEIKIVEGAV